MKYTIYQVDAFAEKLFSGNPAAVIPLTEWLPDELLSTTNHKPLKAFKGKTDYMLVFNNQQEIEELSPNLTAIEKLDARGLIVTAKGNNCDFVSRFFGPQCGVNEDPVTGSAHISHTPYWAELLANSELEAIQVSSRRGKLSCKLIGERVEITGQAVLYMKGQIEL